MTGSELKPVCCGCGGEAIIQTDHDTVVPGEPIDWKRVVCDNCSIRTTWRHTEVEAVEAWNRAMSGSSEEKLKAFWDGMSAEMKKERTAKAKESWGLAMCCACEKRVFPYDNYCSHCGARLEWDK